MVDRDVFGSRPDSKLPRTGFEAWQRETTAFPLSIGILDDLLGCFSFRLYSASYFDAFAGILNFFLKQNWISRPTESAKCHRIEDSRFYMHDAKSRLISPSLAPSMLTT
jgi:hypothetical protein